MRNPSSLQAYVMGFALLNPSYGLTARQSTGPESAQTPDQLHVSDVAPQDADTGVV